MPIDTSATLDDGDADSVRRFVRSPFAVRCRIVKVWRPLPPEFWTALCEPQDAMRAARVERRAAAGVIFLAAMLIALAGIGLIENEGPTARRFPLLVKSSQTLTGGAPQTGWYFEPWQSLRLVSWTIVPSLAGWVFVRLFWIPAAIARKPSRGPTLAMLSHLGSVYFYVYLMIVAGAALMIPLLWIAPRETELLRWCFWCFLFGESFFVPAVMWIRLVVLDRAGLVFGSFRYPILLLYVVLVVVLPIYGMVGELD